MGLRDGRVVSEGAERAVPWRPTPWRAVDGQRGRSLDYPRAGS